MSNEATTSDDLDQLANAVYKSSKVNLRNSEVNARITQETAEKAEAALKSIKKVETNIKKTKRLHKFFLLTLTLFTVSVALWNEQD